MKVDINPIEGVNDAILVTLSGLWDYKDVKEALVRIQNLSPTYLVFDPTNAIIIPSQAQPLDATSEERRHNLQLLVQMMVDNPRMCFIFINRNQNPTFSTASSIFETLNVAERHFFVTTQDEALKVIRECDLKLD